MTESVAGDVEAHAPGAEKMSAVSRTVALGTPARAALWIGGFVLALLFCLQWGQSTSVHNDFTQNVWLPSRLLLQGANPYHPSRAQVDLALGQYSGQFQGFNSGEDYSFIYPVWVGVLLTPFGAMPLLAATALWRALNLVLLIWSVGALMRSSNPVFRALNLPSIAAIIMTVVVCLIYRESILTLYLGQFSILELGLLAAIWRWLVSSQHLDERKRLWGDALTGVALAILVTKPQSVGLAVLLIAAWAAWRRRYTIPVSGALALIVLLLAPLLAYPWSLGDWFGVVAGGQASSQAEVSASVWGVSYQWLGSAPFWSLLALALSLAFVLPVVPRWLRDLRGRTSPVPLTLGLTLCVNSVISPYLLGYEHVLLLLPAVLFLASAGLPGESSGTHLDRSRKLLRLAIYTWVAVLPFLVVAVQSLLDSKEYPVIVQSLSMLAICWIAPLVWTQDGTINDQSSPLSSPNVGGVQAT